MHKFVSPLLSIAAILLAVAVGVLHFTSGSGANSATSSTNTLPATELYRPALEYDPPAPYGRSNGSTMLPIRHLSVQDRWSLVEFVKSVFKPDYPQAPPSVDALATPPQTSDGEPDAATQGGPASELYRS